MILLIACLPVRIYSSLDVSAESAVLMDAETGRIIYEKNAEQKLSMASTTKIITAITAIKYGNLSDVVTVSHNAATTEGSSVWLSEGEKLTLYDLLYAMMLESGNDASVAVAEHIGGNVESFAELMNKVCVEAGAFSTNCITPSGLDDELHYTT
ncbi:MAG: serine hydrolase, partial [Clostridia bacterium]|nr:serine hydrolase [Clostridia bacterium]